MDRSHTRARAIVAAVGAGLMVLPAVGASAQGQPAASDPAQVLRTPPRRDP